MQPFLRTVGARRETGEQGRRVLNAGAGHRGSRQLHPVFRAARWRETRFDIDPATAPDITGSITDMRATAATASYDGVWSSHSLEHLYPHDVPLALAEFRRVLKPHGYAIITSPDLEAVATLLLEQGLDCVAYVSPSGPITPRDMLFGHGDSIAHGRHAMAHRTGFTCASLGALLLEAGFPVVMGKRERFDLWMLALMEKADRAEIVAELREAGLDMSVEGAEAPPAPPRRERA
jgi:SAM-dependent methyltransferase